MRSRSVTGYGLRCLTGTGPEEGPSRVASRACSTKNDMRGAAIWIMKDVESCVAMVDEEYLGLGGFFGGAEGAA